MSGQITVNILSDSDSDDPKPLRRRLQQTDAVDLTTPLLFPNSKKKPRINTFPNPTSPAICVIDDDTPPVEEHPFSTTPAPSSTPSFVAETPFSDVAKRSFPAGLASSSIPSFVADTPLSDAPVEKFSTRRGSTSGESLGLEHLIVSDEPMVELFKPDLPSAKDYSEGPNSGLGRSSISNHKPAETSTLIFVDSDNESEPIDDGFGVSSCSLSPGTSVAMQTDLFMESADQTNTLDGLATPISSEDETSQSDEKAETETRVHVDQIPSQKSTSSGSHKDKKTKTSKGKGASKEERLRLMGEKKQQKEQEKLRKAEAAVMKKRESERKKWEKGKLATEAIVAEIDPKVAELASIGGNLLSRFAEKKIAYKITSNPVKGSIVWNMAVPEGIAATPAEQIEILYVLIIYEAEEFCNSVADGSFMNHVQSVQQQYPHHTICYLTNRLHSYLNKRERAQYKNPASYPGWKLPAIEEALSKLSTHFMRVHSRQCVDEAELAEHVVGLTYSLATCQFRPKATRLSVNANGSFIPKDFGDRDLILKSPWLKALAAIPKVQPRSVIAVGKKYPTMKSLLSVYMDPTKSEHEKEFLLKDLMMEGTHSADRKLGPMCSKRIYRILMAQSGTIDTVDAENGADHFGSQKRDESERMEHIID